MKKKRKTVNFIIWFIVWFILSLVLVGTFNKLKECLTHSTLFKKQILKKKKKKKKKWPYYQQHIHQQSDVMFYRIKQPWGNSHSSVGMNRGNILVSEMRGGRKPRLNLSKVEMKVGLGFRFRLERVYNFVLLITLYRDMVK